MYCMAMNTDTDTKEFNNVYPLWVGRYLDIPYRKEGRDRSGLDDWGLIRLVIAEQFGYPIHTMFNSTDKMKLSQARLYNHLSYIVAADLGKDKVLFGITLPGKRMLTCVPSGPCLMKYTRNLIGEK